MLFGLGVDGVVLLYVAYLLRSPTRRRGRHGPGSDRSVDQHAARHVDDGSDVLRTDVRRLPEPAAARTLIGHSMLICGAADAAPGPGAAAAPALLARTAAHADDAAPGGLDRRVIGWPSSVGAVVVTCVLGAVADAAAGQSDTRSPALGDRCRAARGADWRAPSACPTTSTSCSPRARTSSRCSTTNERLAARVSTELPGAGVSVADARCFRRPPPQARAAAAPGRVRGCRPTPCARSLERAGRRQGSDQDRSTRSPARLPTSARRRRSG